MISVAIPTYETFGRGIEFLQKNFDQLEKQIFKDFEIIISDHSKDNKIENFCISYMNKFNLKYIRNEKMRGSLSNNTNNAIKNCSGEIIKILFQDDFLYDEKSLQIINNSFDENTFWLATSCIHTNDGINFFNKILPLYNEEIMFGKNTIGNPSVIAIKNSQNDIYFDEKLTWMVDVDFYKKMNDKFGKPKIIDETTVAIRLWEKQLTHLIPESLKEKEKQIMVNRYA